MALNFPANPKEGQIHFDPSNGVTYTYKNGGWVASSGTQDDLDLRYVEVTGDNMTGDLTLGTDKITLNATDGSITADGNITNTGATLYSNGSADFNNQTVRINGSGSILAGTTSYSEADAKIALKGSDGSITADGAGLFSFSRTFNDDNKPAIYLGTYETYSSLLVKNPSSYTGAAFQVLSDGYGPSNVKIELKNDGSITAAGAVQGGTAGSGGTDLGIVAFADSSTTDGSGQLGAVYAQNSTAGGRNFSGASSTDGANVTCEILENGSASFSGQVTANGGIKFGDGTIQLTAASGSGGGDLQSVTDAGNTTTNNILIGGTLPSSPNITLNAADGWASFEGLINLGNKSETRGGASLYADGRAYWRNDDATAPVLRVFTGGYGDAFETFSVSKEGSITAAGDVNIGGLSSAPNITLNASGNIFVPYDGSYNFGVTGTALKIDYVDTNWVEGTFEICELDAAGVRYPHLSIKGNGLTSAATFDGTAEFAGVTRAVAAAGAAGGYRHAQTEAGYYLQDDAGNSSISLFKDGSAEFGGAMESKSIRIKDNNTYPRIIGTPDGTFYSEESAGNYPWQLKPDGTAEFGAKVTAKSTTTNNADLVIANQGSDQLQIGVNTSSCYFLKASATDYVFYNSTSSIDNEIRFDDSGSATFGGANFALNTSTGCKVYGTGLINVQRVAGAGDSIFEGWAGTTRNIELFADGRGKFTGNITAGNVTFNLEANDDTKYTSTTDANGEVTTVYNGATLDVKDRLTKLDTALTGLKAALVSTTDHASLKAALITALADI